MLIICSKCQKDNTLDGCFCRWCGAELDQSILKSMIEKALGDVHEGVRLVESGRIEEARMVAEMAIENHPDLPDAHALLGEALEKQCKWDDSLRAYRRASELRPDDTLVKVHIQHIEQVLASKELAVPQQRAKRTALIASIAACFLVVSVGSAWALIASGRQVERIGRSTGVKSDIDGFQVASNSQIATNDRQSNGTPTDPENSDAVRSNEQAQNSPTGPNQGTLHPENPPLNSVRNSATLPDTGTGSRSSDEPVKPWSPGGIINIVPEKAYPGPSTDPDPGSSLTKPSPNKDEDPKPSTPPDPDPPKKNSIVNITVRDSGTPKVGGSQGIDDPKPGPESKNWGEIASKAFQSGDYATAADAYRKSLASGAPQGTTYQRIGQCYEKLGRNGDAIEAYNHARASFQSQLDAAGGNDRRLKAAVEACEAAIRVLKGG